MKTKLKDEDKRPEEMTSNQDTSRFWKNGEGAGVDCLKEDYHREATKGNFQGNDEQDSLQKRVFDADDTKAAIKRIDPI